MVPKIFFFFFLRAEKISWLKWCIFVFPSTCPDPAQSRMMSSKALWKGSASLLWLSHRSHPRAPFVKTACLHAVSTSYDACPVSPAGPYNTIPTTTNHQHQSHYLLASVRWKVGATSSWDQHRNWMSQFWISQKCRGYKPAPSKRERGGKSGRSLNRRERCPHHWKLVIGLYFTLPPEK